VGSSGQNRTVTDVPSHLAGLSSSPEGSRPIALWTHPLLEWCMQQPPREALARWAAKPSESGERERTCQAGIDLGRQPVREAADALAERGAVNCRDLRDVDDRVSVQASDVGRNRDVAR
jgi:hypothetical protein